MFTDLEIPFDRIAWRPGQLLTARDMRDEHRRDARLRRLHNRYIHGTWGIALGYTAASSADMKSVIVQPGYAIDTAGHDLLLPKAALARVPTGGNGIYLLALAWREYREVKTESCAGDGFSAGGELPRIVWLRPEEYRKGEHILIARAQIGGQLLQGALDFRVRRYARRMTRPHVAWGATEALRTEWIDVTGPDEEPLWLDAVVDTSEGGFVRTPYYFTRLVRDREGGISNESEKSDPLQQFGQTSAHLLSGAAWVEAPSPKRFVYRMLRAPFPFGFDFSANDARMAGWSVSWAGLEPVGGAEPAKSSSIFFLPNF